MSKRRPRQKSQKNRFTKQRWVSTNAQDDTRHGHEVLVGNTQGLKRTYPTEISYSLEAYQFVDHIAGCSKGFACNCQRKDMQDGHFPGFKVPERIKTLRKIRDITLDKQSDIWAKIIDWNRTVLSNTPRACDTLFWYGNEAHIVHANKRTNEVSVSRLYHGRDHAVRLYKGDLIQYKATIIQDLFIQLSG